MYSGRHIYFLRIIKNLSQRKVTSRLGISQQALSKWENEKWLDNKKIERFLAAVRSTRKELDEIKKIYPPPHLQMKKMGSKFIPQNIHPNIINGNPPSLDAA